MMFHFQLPKKTKLLMMAITTSEVSMIIFILANGIFVTWPNATVMPSPGMVTEPHFTSKAIPKAMITHPANWADICDAMP